MWITQWIVPIITSFIGGLIIIVIQRYYVVWGTVSFFGYPNISGKHKVTYPDNEDYDEEIVDLSQIGSRFKGNTIKSPDKIYAVFQGNVSRTGLITYQFRPKIAEHNDYGVGLLQLKKYRNEADGIVLFIDDEHQTLRSVKVHVEKL